jgi:hypothetical protein
MAAETGGGMNNPRDNAHNSLLEAYKKVQKDHADYRVAWNPHFLTGIIVANFLVEAIVSALIYIGDQIGENRGRDD